MIFFVTTAVFVSVTISLNNNRYSQTFGCQAMRGRADSEQVGFEGVGEEIRITPLQEAPCATYSSQPSHESHLTINHPAIFTIKCFS